MPAYKDSKQGTWYASFYFENWQGVKQKKLKRGFATKKDALAWEREFLLQQAADLTMTFEAFVEFISRTRKSDSGKTPGLPKSTSSERKSYRISKKSGSARSSHGM